MRPDFYSPLVTELTGVSLYACQCFSRKSLNTEKKTERNVNVSFDVIECADN